MKIYKRNNIADSADLKRGTVEYLFKIIYVDFMQDDSTKKDALAMDLVKGNDELNVAYWLVGKKHYTEFLKEMDVKESEIEKLVGKKVVGFVHDSEPDTLQGIKVKGKPIVK